MFSLHNLLAKCYKMHKVYPSETYKIITASKRLGQRQKATGWKTFSEHTSQLMPKLEVAVLKPLQCLTPVPNETVGIQISRHKNAQLGALGGSAR